MSLEVPKFDPQVFLQITLRWDSEDKEVLTQLAARIDKEVWQDPDHPVGVNRVSVTDAHLHGVPSYLTLHAPKSLRKEMLAVSYYGGLSDPSVVEYFPITHEGYAGQKALNAVVTIAGKAGVNFIKADALEEWADRLNGGDCPGAIQYRRDGKYYRVMKRSWNDA